MDALHTRAVQVLHVRGGQEGLGRVLERTSSRTYLGGGVVRGDHPVGPHVGAPVVVVEVVGAGGATEDRPAVTTCTWSLSSPPAPSFVTCVEGVLVQGVRVLV